MLRQVRLRIVMNQSVIVVENAFTIGAPPRKTLHLRFGLREDCASTLVGGAGAVASGQERECEERRKKRKKSGE